MNPEVDNFLVDGCGRCPLYKTPQCKVISWHTELKLLRQIVLNCGLTEAYKWSQPCYTVNQRNVLIVSAFNDYAFISFFKGSLLKDTDGLLVKAGKNSQAGRQLRFASPQQIIEQEALIKAYVFEAIELEKAGKKVTFNKNPEPIPAELELAFEQNPALKDAFEALTPGRQRGYIIHFSQPKQSKTRMARIEKQSEKILRGEGFHDAYRKNRK